MPYRYSFFRRAIHYLTIVATILGLVLGIAQPQYSVQAASSLTVTPITWNVVGLDSNYPASGPANYPVGVRACNPASSTTSVNAVQAAFVWTTANAYIDLRSGSLNPIMPSPAINLAPGQCTDFYFEVSVVRSSLAYNQARRYRIDVSGTDSGSGLPVTQSSPTPREIFVERLVSQSRNSTIDMRLDGVSIAVGGTMSLIVGNTYTITLVSSTATNGYNQIETFINFPNTIFQVLSVSQTYSADSSGYVPNPDSKLYGDACFWDNNPTSLTYRSCIGSDGKAGGTITSVYTVRIIGGAGTSQVLNTLIYDFSGSSYHYNSDFSFSTRIASISSPVNISKSFAPTSIPAGGTSTLSFTLTNTSTTEVSGISFIDNLPTSPAQMRVATINTLPSGCGTPTLTAITNSTSISFSNGTIAASDTCTFSVDVTAPTSGIYTNTTGPLLINSVSTGLTATANLGVATTSTSCDLVLAKWSMEPSQGTGTPPAPFIRSNLVPSATASTHASLTQSINTTTGLAAINSWQANRFTTSDPLVPATDRYFLFAVDTRNYTGVQLSFNHMRSNNGPQNYAVYYGTSSTPPQTMKLTEGIVNTTWTSSGLINFTGQTSTTGITYFFIYGYDANNSGNDSQMMLDDITFTGCNTALKPTLSKSFSPSTIGVGSTSTLSFTLGNTNSVALSNASFTDNLPFGLQVAATPAASNTCGATFAPLAGATTISLTGGTIPAIGSCTAQVNVTTTSPGTFNNVSGFISTTETGTNSGADGYGSASLLVLAQPGFSKRFSPNPIYTGQVSTLTFSITNPNSLTIPGVGFTDTLPGSLVIASPSGAAYSNCSTGSTPTLTATSGTNAITFSGAGIAAGATCTVTVDVTTTNTGDYANTSSGLTTGIAGLTAPAATDTLAVITTHPTIALNKMVSTIASGPWSSYTTVGLPGSIYYRFIVENTGDTQLTSIGVTDLGPTTVDLSSCTWPAILDPGLSATCIVGSIAAVSGSHVNSASAQGTYNSVVYNSPTDSATYETTALSLMKNAVQASFSAAGDTINYNYLVTNTGAAPLAGPVIINDSNSAVSCPAVNTVGNGDGNLDNGESLTCTSTYTVTAIDVTIGSVSNTAIASAGGVSSNRAYETVYRNLPDLTITKTNDTSGYSAPGISFTWTLTATNAGPADAVFSTGQVILSDSLPAGATYGTPSVGNFTNITNSANIACGIVGTVLSCSASSASVTLGATTGSFTVDIPVTPNVAGDLVNTAVIDPDSNISEGNESNNSGSDTVNVQSFSLSLTKNGNPTYYTTAGEIITYTYTLQNTGSVALQSPYSITDDHVIPGDIDCSAATSPLDPGATTTCSGTFTITASDVTAGSVTNTATASAFFGSIPVTSGTATETVAYLGVTLDKTVAPLTLPEPGDDFTYTLTITNDSGVAVTITALTDDNVLSAECLALVGTSLAAGASTSCTYSVTHTETGSYNNTANLTVEDGDGNTVSDSDNASVAVTDVLPTVALDKSVAPVTLAEPGGDFTYTLTINNTSVEAVTITGLTDDNGLSVECLALIGTSIPAGGTTSCTNTVSHAETGTYPNDASVTVQDNEANSASGSDSESVTITDVLPTMTLDKSVSPASLPEPGGAFTYILLITNTSPESVTITALTDDNPLSAECLALVGTSLTAGANTSCTYTFSYTETGAYPNTAQVTVQDNETNSASASDSASATVTDTPPTVTLDKSASPLTLPEPGGVFTYTLAIVNTSTEAVIITALTDDNALSAECLALIGTNLAAGASTSCTYPATPTEAGTYPNTAMVTVQDNEGTTGTGTDTETVTVTNTLPTVTLDKSVTPATLVEPGGDFTYTLTITNTSLEAVTITALTDDNPLSTDCTDLIGDVLGSGASASCTYIVTRNLVGVYPNTANVTVSDNEGSTATGSDSASVSVTTVPPAINLDKSVVPASLAEPGGDFTYTLTINNTGIKPFTITAMTDDNPLSASCLALIGTSLGVGGSTSCNYTVNHTEASIYPNTAGITVTDTDGNTATDSDAESVTVTDVLPAVTIDKTGALLTLPEPGGAFTFTLVITNNSVETVTVTGLTDDNGLSADCLALIGTSIPAGSTVSCTNSASHTEPGTYPNTASVTVQDNEGNPASDSDSETVTVTDVLPTVTLDKSVLPASLPEPGGLFTYTLLITNTSPEIVTITALTDSNPLSAECTALIGTTLASGAGTSCTYTVSQTEAGSYNNTANVTVSDNDGSSGSASSSASVTITDVLPTVTLDKSVAPASLAEPGGDFTYTLTITNASIEAVTITALTDDNPLSAVCTALIGTSIPAGGSTSCAYTVAQTEAGTYPNDATVTVSDNEGNTASDTHSESVTVTDELPTVTLDKSVAPDTLAEPGGVFTYTLAITNTSPEVVIITTLTDTNPLSPACIALIGTGLASGATTSCTYTVSHTEAGTYNNTADVTVSDNEGNTSSDTDSETVSVTDVLPTVTLVKSVDTATLPEPGGLFTYTLSIANTSPESVTITALTDSNPLSAACNALVGTSLAAGANASCTYTVTQTDTGTYPNTVDVTVQDNEGNNALASDSKTVSVTDVLPTVDLVKAAAPATLAEPGGAFTYTLTINNTSIEPVTITALTDSNPLSAACLALIGTSIPAGGNTSCTYSGSFTEPGTYPNTASVTVQDNEANTASDSDSESVTVTDVLPTIDLVKSVLPTTLPEPGGLFTYTLAITNTSPEIVTITALTDSNPLSADCLALIGTNLASGASTSCTYTVNQTDTGSYPNTAQITVEDNESNSASYNDTVTVTVTDTPPTVTIDKSAAPLSLPEPGGDFTFTLVITNTSSEAVTITALTDDNPLSAACLALVGTSLGAGGSTSCTYTATHTDAGSYANTAAVIVTDDDGSTGTDDDSETVSVSDVLPTVTLDKSVAPASLPEPGGAFTYTLTITNTSVESFTITALTDTNPLSPACTALIGASLDSGASTSCSYTVTQTAPGTYNNTADVTVGDNEGNIASDTDTETVTVMDALPTVALIKSALPATLAEPGGVFTYTLSITNTSPEAVTITALTDDNPLGVDCLALVGTSLAAGANTSCTYTITRMDTGTYPNDATVTIADNDGNSASDTSSASVSVTDVLPTVTLDKSVTPAILPIPGGLFTYTLTITNTSPESVTITSLMDDNPLSAACTTLIGTSLGAGASTSCTYDVTQTAVGTYPNTAIVTISDNEGNSAQDSDSETVEVTNIIADLAIVKTASADPVNVNAAFLYTLTVTNNGPDDASNLSVTDDLPADAVFVSTVAAGWTCTYDIPTHSVTCTLPSLTVGSSSSITINMTAPSFETTLSNQASVTGSVSDPDPANNADTLDILVAQADPDALSKDLTATSETFTTDPNVAIGEILTFEVIITVPPGTFATSQLVDTLGQGLAYVDCVNIVPETADLTTSIAGGFAGICAGTLPTEYPGGSTDDVDQGRLITYDFGTLTNAGTDPLELTVTYRAVVLDAIGNQDGDLLSNSAVYTWAGGSVGPATGGAVRVREPELTIDKVSSTGFVRVGDTVTFTITIAHSGASNTNAYDTLISDVVPAELQVIPASLDCALGVQDADTCSFDAGTGTITASWLNFALGGGNGAVRFQATVLSIPVVGGITNLSSVEWTSLPADLGQISLYNILSTERYYDPADPANNYGTTASVTLNALGGAALPATGFAPGVRTDLSDLIITQYSQSADLTLEIPSLKLNLPIVGVPLQGGDWDLNWLWNQAGWLQGTAYPTLEGNSVLTAHVYLPNGLPGPFIDIGKLYWGQEIAVVSNGQRNVYQVREVKKIKPDDLSVFKHEARAWLTLLTCKEYDEQTGNYRSRLVVRAVLIRIEEITK